VEHTVEEHEAFRGGGPRLDRLRGNDWVDHVGQNSKLTVAVKEPEVEHTVLIRDFANWLASNGKSPAEQALKTDLRVLLNAGIDDKPVRRG
jgi:hypothetical protein